MGFVVIVRCGDSECMPLFAASGKWSAWSARQAEAGPVCLPGMRCVTLTPCQKERSSSFRWVHQYWRSDPAKLAST